MNHSEEIGSGGSSPDVAGTLERRGTDWLWLVIAPLTLLLAVGSGNAIAGLFYPPLAQAPAAPVRGDTDRLVAATPTIWPTRTPLPTFEITIFDAGRPAATVTPTPLPPLLVTSIEPLDAFVGALPIAWRVRGSRLDEVRRAELELDDGTRLALDVAVGTSNDATFRLLELTTPITDTARAILRLNDAVVETRPLLLRNYLAIKTVQGIKSEYAPTTRVLEDVNGPYTTIHAVSSVYSAKEAALRNGEEVAILRDDVEGWYRVRIRAAADPGREGAVGWIERWLIDDRVEPAGRSEPTAASVPASAPPKRVPPTATPSPTPRPRPKPQPTAPPSPQPRAFNALVVRSFPGTGQSGEYASCVEGRVQGSNGRGVAAAVIGANNGASDVSVQTNGDGFYRLCGLGDSTWSVVLRWIPGAAPLAQEVAATVYVSGNQFQVASVDFHER